MPDNKQPRNHYQRIYDVVCRIPEGKVATYGDVAALAGLPNHARLAGYALYNLPSELSDVVPWHRVLNAKGTLSIGRVKPDGNTRQQRLLEAEGVEFSNGKINLRHYRWVPNAVATDHRR